MFKGINNILTGDNGIRAEINELLYHSSGFS